MIRGRRSIRRFNSKNVDADKIDRGTKIITNTVIGLILVFLAGLIIQTVIKVLEGGGKL